MKYAHRLFICCIFFASLSSAVFANPAAWQAFWANVNKAASVTTIILGVKEGNEFLNSQNATVSLFKWNPNIEQMIPEIKRIISESGERGVMLKANYYVFSIDGKEQTAYAGMLPIGFGSAPEDAALKGHLAEDTLGPKFPEIGLINPKIAHFDESAKVSDQTFGIWIEMDENGKLQGKVVRNITEIDDTARLRWRLLKNDVYQLQNAPFFERLGREATVYSAHVQRLNTKKLDTELSNNLNVLAQKMRYANDRLTDAVRMRDQSLARAKKYRHWADVATILGAASSVVGAYENSAGKSQASADYHQTASDRLQFNYNETKVEFNFFLIDNFNLSAEGLPQEPIAVPPKD